MIYKKYIRAINLISVIVIVIMLNLITANSLMKIDLTKNKIYTLSEGTHHIINEIPGKILIKVIVSSDIPSQYNDRIDYFANLLKEYKELSKGKITLEIISSDNTRELGEIAELYGIPPIQINAIEENNLQIKRVFMGAVFLYRDKKETIPVIANLNNMEYEISAAIKRITREDKPKLAIINAGNSANMRQGLSILQRALTKDYSVENIYLGNKNLKINKEIDTALLVSPQISLTDNVTYALEQFLMSGKNLILALDIVQGSPQRGFASSLDTGLEDFLEKNGIHLSKKIIYDLNASIINISNRSGGFSISTSLRYYFFPQISNFNKEHPITKDLSSVNLIYPTPIIIKNDNETNSDLKYTVLAKSSENSGLESQPYNIMLEREFKMEDFNKESQIVAILAEGKFKNTFDKPLKGLENNFKKNGTGKLVLISDGDFIKDQYVSSGNNLDFILNTIDYLAAEPELTLIRGKSFTYNPITLKNITLQNILKITSIFLPIVLAFLIIIIVTFSLKKRRLPK
ncbi:MAG: GldG family protein [Deferribacterota bacterium]|nr:GldG family protein [Deferribacterota bacterium]